MKKGFTLVELLATITILGIIALLIVPTVTNVINEFKSDAQKNQEETIVSAAKSWATDNRLQLPEVGETPLCVTVSTLKKGYLDKDLKDPKTQEPIKDNACVEIKKVKKNYTYTYFKDGK
ncbi:MAG: type II secretion system protein [Firmicutes bacterium]|nr:type II secretion system protein [Bacillota bacterium]